MNPENILAKGYSITTDAEQRVVRDASALAAGEKIRIRFARGTRRGEGDQGVNHEKRNARF